MSILSNFVFICFVSVFNRNSTIMILKRELQISCFLSLSRDICTQIVDLSVFISTSPHVKKGRTNLLLTFSVLRIVILILSMVLFTCHHSFIWNFFNKTFTFSLGDMKIKTRSDRKNQNNGQNDGCGHILPRKCHFYFQKYVTW